MYWLYWYNWVKCRITAICWLYPHSILHEIVKCKICNTLNTLNARLLICASDLWWLQGNTIQIYRIHADLPVYSRLCCSRGRDPSPESPVPVVITPAADSPASPPPRPRISLPGRPGPGPSPTTTRRPLRSTPWGTTPWDQRVRRLRHITSLTLPTCCCSSPLKCVASQVHDLQSQWELTSDNSQAAVRPRCLLSWTCFNYWVPSPNGRRISNLLLIIKCIDREGGGFNFPPLTSHL